MKWEYKIETWLGYGGRDRDLTRAQDLVEWLNVFGASGWELVQFSAVDGGVFFQRPLERQFRDGAIEQMPGG